MQIARYKNMFLQQLTGDVFHIYKAYMTDPITYKLKDNDGEIIGDFLQRRIEKNMNLQITSNQILDYHDNKVTDFIMELDCPLDAYAGDMYIQANEFFYPATIKNVGDDDCFSC